MNERSGREAMRLFQENNHDNNSTPDLAADIAARILELYKVETHRNESVLFDPDFDEIDEHELAKLIRDFIDGK